MVEGGYHNGYVFLDSKNGSVFGPKKGGNIDFMHAEFHYHYLMDDNEIPLAALIREGGDNCDYVYGLGDRWYRKITVEQVEIEGVDDKSKGVVVLLGGTGVCPPEDSNGLEPSAFAEFLADRHEISEKAARPASRS